MGNKSSPHTVQMYCCHVRSLLTWAEKSAEEITPGDLEHYKRYLAVERDYSKNSLYGAVKAIQAFYRFLGADTAAGLKPPRRGDPLPKYLSPEETGRLLEAAQKSRRNFAILVTLGYTGLRVSELCSLRVEDLDFGGRTLTVRHGKGDKDRVVPLDEKCTLALRAYLAEEGMPPSGVLFRSTRGQPLYPRAVQRMIKTYAKRAGIARVVTPHVLRHTFATTLLANGADIRIIQKILGHRSIATTQIYTHVDGRLLKQAFE
ncbi:MAG TPA: site-specific tyrosine recombinase/integron integrase, partial [Candidatus Thermoplasmatota archaeon]